MVYYKLRARGRVYTEDEYCSVSSSSSIKSDSNQMLDVGVSESDKAASFAYDGHKRSMKK